MIDLRKLPYFDGWPRLPLENSSASDNTGRQWSTALACLIFVPLTTSWILFSKSTSFTVNANIACLPRLTETPGASELIDLVNQIPAIYLYPDINQSSPSAFSERLRFLVKFTEYHCLTAAGKLSEAASDLVAMFRDALAPKYWWGVLLVEAGGLLRGSSDKRCLPYSKTETAFLQDDDMLLSLDEVHELLRRLEEVAMGAEHGAGADYLGALQRRASVSPRDEKWALQQLLAVRLALAQYLGRSATIHVGGKGPIVFN